MVFHGSSFVLSVSLFGAWGVARFAKVVPKCSSCWVLGAFPRRVLDSISISFPHLALCSGHDGICGLRMIFYLDYQSM